MFVRAARQNETFAPITWSSLEINPFFISVKNQNHSSQAELLWRCHESLFQYQNQQKDYLWVDLQLFYCPTLTLVTRSQQKCEIISKTHEFEIFISTNCVKWSFSHWGAFVCVVWGVFAALKRHMLWPLLKNEQRGNWRPEGKECELDTITRSEEEKLEI